MKKIKAILFLTLLAVSTAFTVNKASPGYEVGDVATDFSLKNIDGKMVSLSDYDDANGFVVIFTCNHCPFSIAYEDRIIAIDKKYKNLGYPVIAINPNNPEVSKGDDFVSMQKRAKDKGFTFPYLFDDGQKIYPQYGAKYTPHVFVLNKVDGDLVVAYIGAIDSNSSDESKAENKFLEDALDALVVGDNPEITYTKAIGCTIKK
ncbi:thioredoxin family protein [Urechidicola croceus]|uniref:Thioredoxin family protein n=1 Tax=Urechidicola croceus TaxID=1850246 RepID=A0A1D8PB05_9FLAO|nr:thioredoxin family protein [Urechidicola croceus]AOW21741.1 thioredoxin family protein [Urechidicola croceus]